MKKKIRIILVFIVVFFSFESFSQNYNVTGLSARVHYTKNIKSKYEHQPFNVELDLTLKLVTLLSTEINEIYRITHFVESGEGFIILKLKDTSNSIVNLKLIDHGNDKVSCFFHFEIIDTTIEYFGFFQKVNK
jgi:hypothetical protein